VNSFSNIYYMYCNSAGSIKNKCSISQARHIELYHRMFLNSLSMATGKRIKIKLNQRYSRTSSSGPVTGHLPATATSLQRPPPYNGHPSTTASSLNGHLPTTATSLQRSPLYNSFLPKRPPPYNGHPSTTASSLNGHLSTTATSLQWPPP